MYREALEFRQLTPEWSESLGHMFAVLRERGEDEQFHPHPLTAEHAESLGSYSGKDLYYVAVSNGTVVGYGMLRGWDEGYEVPSLGIALHPSARGTGLGEAFMKFLHVAAGREGAKRIRLRVDKTNLRAKRLYERLGYCFKDEDSGQLVGYLVLHLPALQ
ncbi:MAG: GNAT family N-acetyltransferase [Candidatus Binataceae bacterium]